MELKGKKKHLAGSYPSIHYAFVYLALQQKTVGGGDIRPEKQQKVAETQGTPQEEGCLMGNCHDYPVLYRTVYSSVCLGCGLP